MHSVRVLLAAAAAAAVASEVAHARASRRVPRPDPDRALAVVVLGCRSRPGGRPHPLQRWRVAIGVRTLRGHQDGVLVLSGAAREGPSEAQVMARLAAAAGVPRSRLVLEEKATTTWENVARTAPLVEGYPQVAFASAPLHAARARAYLARQRPDLAGRLVGAEDYRPLERPALKVATAGYRLLLLARHALAGFSAEAALGQRSRSSRPTSQSFSDTRSLERSGRLRA